MPDITGAYRCCPLDVTPRTRVTYRGPTDRETGLEMPGEGRNSCSGVGFVEKLDGMADAQFQAGFLRALLDPGEAAGVAGGDNRRAGRLDIGDLAVEELAGQFRLGDI